MKIRVGILGAGDWAMSNHLPALALVREHGLAPYDIELAALCEVNDERADRALRDFSIGRRVASPSDLFNACDVDAVAIIVRATQAAGFVQQAQLAGKPFLVEKPSAATAEVARALAALVTVPNVVGFNRRYFPVIEELERTLRLLPMPRLISATFLRHGRRDSEEYAADPNSNRFPFMTGTGIHMINICEHLFGEIVSISGKRTPVQPEGVSGWTAHFGFADGSTMDAVFLSTSGTSVERLEVHTPETSVFARFGLYGEADLPGSIEVHRSGRMVSSWSPLENRPLVARGFVGEYLDLFAAMIDGVPTRSNVGNAHTSLRWAEFLENLSSCKPMSPGRSSD